MPVTVEVAFAAAPLDLAPVWTQVSATVGKVISAHIRRGRRVNEGDAQPGTATVVLDDRDRKLDPTNPASPYAASLVPMRQVRISQTLASGAVEALFAGFIDDFSTAWKIGASETTITCVDAMAWFATQRLTRSAYAAIVLADAPMAHYRMGEPTGSARVLDASPNARHSGFKTSGIETGSFKNATPGAVVGDADTAADMAATGSIPLPAAAVPTGTGAMSIEMFLRHEGAAPGVDMKLLELFGKWPVGGTDNVHTVLYIAANGRWQVNRHNVTTGAQVAITAPPTILDGQWHHTVWTRAADGVTHRLYVDGVLAISGTLLGHNVIGGLLATSLLGGDYLADELALYSAELSAARVAAHHAEARGKWGLPTVQRSGARVGLVCDLVGWPAAKRSIDAGVEDVMGPEVAVGNDIEDKAASVHLAEVSAVEGGRLFMTRGGVLRFLARPVVAPATVASYRNDGAGLRFVRGRPSRRRADIVNHADVARIGGVPRMAESASSVARYLRHDAASRTGWYGDDMDATSAAVRVVAAGKESVTRLDQLAVNARIGAAEEASCAQRDLGDVVAVRLTPPQGSPLDMVCAVEGISHDIDTGRRWRVTYDLSLVSIAQTPSAVVVAVPDTAWGSGVYAAVPLPYEYSDTANLHSARSTPDRLTVPAAGDWLVTATAQVELASAGGVLVAIVAAGLTYGGHSSRHNSGNNTCLTTTSVVRLAAGDTVQMFVLATSGASKLIQFRSAYSPVLSAVRIG